VLVAGATIMAGAGFATAGGESSAPSPRSASCASYRDDYAYPIQLCGKGEGVRVAQVGLRNAGHDIAADRYFGPRTLAAVHAFQQANGLPVTGQIDELTWVALTGGDAAGHDADADGIVDPWEVGGRPPSPPTGSSCDRYQPVDWEYPIRRCERGWLVYSVQTMLDGLGYDVRLDGHFGPQTERAVLAFQDDSGLAVDGLVGPRTWSALSGEFPPIANDQDGSGLADPWDYPADCFLSNGEWECAGE
jgi:peptidoglycan hydrolase-like protein with peptidoglycan-binding domain